MILTSVILTTVFIGYKDGGWNDVYLNEVKMTGETTQTSEQVRKAHEDLAKALEAEAKAKLTPAADNRKTYVITSHFGEKIITREVRGTSIHLVVETPSYGTWDVVSEEGIVASFNFDHVLDWQVKGKV